ncbi:hypothetical protein FA13DRAFT_107903 [Coprinellus micaceus]|uniref:Uncharacterized protein n=1 Tax=Coprinellus micaceus TaxID=71717 RepID=A0A4Y7THS9_COPMI|nr:hypothetical protein FA13DRAFT_107903 [Coprinellus micaceus]
MVSGNLYCVVAKVGGGIVALLGMALGSASRDKRSSINLKAQASIGVASKGDSKGHSPPAGLVRLVDACWLSGVDQVDDLYVRSSSGGHESLFPSAAAGKVESKYSTNSTRSPLIATRNGFETGWSLSGSDELDRSDGWSSCFSREARFEGFFLV